MAHAIHLVRHADAAPQEAEPRYFGITDLALSDVGRRQAPRLRAALKQLGVARAVVSPLRRARETAELALPSLVADAEVWPDLREVDFGRWEGKTFAEIQAADPTLVDAWAARESDFRFPEGESLAEFEARLSRLLPRLVDGGAADLAMVTHGGIIRGLMRRLLGLPVACELALAIPHASVATLLVEGECGVLRSIIPAEPTQGGVA